MPLDWDITKVKNRSELCFEIVNERKTLRQITEHLIWLTELIGVPVITEDNYMDFWRRVYIYERLHGNRIFVRNADEILVGQPITMLQVWEHIGLRTNARRLTDSKFEKECTAELNRCALEQQMTEARLLELSGLSSPK